MLPQPLISHPTLRKLYPTPLPHLAETLTVISKKSDPPKSYPTSSVPGDPSSQAMESPCSAGAISLHGPTSQEQPAFSLLDLSA